MDCTTVLDSFRLIVIDSAQSTKKRARKYGEKLAINGSFEDVIKLSVEPYTPGSKSKSVKPPKKK